MFVLTKEVTIEAAHRLPDHPGKCCNLHGHSWDVTVVLFSKHLNKVGMVADFGEIKKLVNQFDHQMLNEMSPFDCAECPPTSENFAQVLVTECLAEFKHVERVEVTVKETKGSTVTCIQNAV